MTNIVVLERWDIFFYRCRLVSDGEKIWLEYQNIFNHGPSFWRVDDGIGVCDVETANQIIPLFS